jgi:hypothetical protein
VDGGIVLPELAQTRAFPAAAGLGTPLRQEDEVGKMSLDKCGDRFAVARLKPKRTSSSSAAS